MPFTKKHDQKSLTLPSLIDVVFLLLIYSLVTIPMERGGPSEEFPLPSIQSPIAQDAEAVIKNMVIQIENEIRNDPRTRRVVFILLPTQRNITIEEAKRMAIQAQRYASLSSDSIRTLSDSQFRTSTMGRLIRNEIQNYVNRFPRTNRPRINRIEIRAVQNTEFRLLNFILRECSEYGDSIPSIAVRILSQTG